MGAGTGRRIVWKCLESNMRVILRGKGKHLCLKTRPLLEGGEAVCSSAAARGDVNAD